MGTYVNIKIKKGVDLTPEEANTLWEEFSNEIVEKDYPLQNTSCPGPAGYTLHFETASDLMEDARWAKTNWPHLGFRPTMTDRQATKLLQKVFGSNKRNWCACGWFRVGACQLKISGGFYCYHTLELVKVFLEQYTKYFEWDDEDGALQEAIDFGEMITTSRYCQVCKRLADEEDITLPIAEDQNYNEILHKVKSLQ